MVSRKAQTASDELHRRRKKLGLFLLCAAIVAVCLLLAVAALTFLHSRSQSWEVGSYDELLESGLMKGRWLPPTMPESTRDLKAWTDLDSGAIEAEFYIDPSDITELTGDYEELTPEEIPAEFVLYDGPLPAEFRCFRRNSPDSIFTAFIFFEPNTGRVEYRSPLRSGVKR